MDGISARFKSSHLSVTSCNISLEWTRTFVSSISEFPDHASRCAIRSGYVQVIKSWHLLP
jgi:hypothetical protein